MQVHSDLAVIQPIWGISVQPQHKTSEHNIFVEKLGNANCMQFAFVSSRSVDTQAIRKARSRLLNRVLLDQIILQAYPVSGFKDQFLTPAERNKRQIDF